MLELQDPVRFFIHSFLLKLFAIKSFSGTFIALNTAVSRLLAARSINLSATSQAIRDQRAFSIGTPSQWIFVHRALIQFAINRRLVSTDYDLNELHGDDAADSYFNTNIFYPQIVAAITAGLSHEP